MDEGSGGGVGGESARVASAFVTVGGRQRFEVELRPGETTIVSWKKLVKDATNPDASVSVPKPPTNAHPALESRIAPGQPCDNEGNDAPPGSRFSAVIEKIERLYMGKHSSDEEDLNDIPDDDEYDTEDSFIDDTELDEYFEVDNSTIKHDGFFVNRGKLENIEPTLLPSQQPKKRRRKDLAKGNGASDERPGPNKHVKVGKRAGAKAVPLVGKNSLSLSHYLDISNAHCENIKLQNQMNASELLSKKKSADMKSTIDASSARVPYTDVAQEKKDAEEQKTGIVSSKNQGNKLKEGGEIYDASNQKLNDKSSYAQGKAQPERLLNNDEELEQSIHRREKNGIHERPEINVPEGRNMMQSSIMMQKVPVMQRKEGSSVRPKSTMLEKAIRELEKTVAESRPPVMEVADADTSSQAVKRRLPPEIKQKLAKVARLAASHGKISKELISRLMSIVGHLIQLRTLKDLSSSNIPNFNTIKQLQKGPPAMCKFLLIQVRSHRQERNLKIMVNMGLSAKQEKDVRFQQLKKEVVEMIKLRVPFMKSKVLEQQAGESDDFQGTGNEEKGSLKRKCSMDDALEEKICDLYDLYVEGLDEDAGPQVRKLYVELAGLWPSGFMDNHGIKRAICRAKDRRRAFYNRNKEQEKIRRKKILVPKSDEIVRVEASSTAHPQYMQEKSVVDLGSHGLATINRSTFSTVAANATVRVPTNFVNDTNVDRPGRQEKVKSSSSNCSNERQTDMQVKKKVKRKPELDLNQAQPYPEKLPSGRGEERYKSNKQGGGSFLKANPQSTAPPPNFVQPS